MGITEWGILMRHAKTGYMHPSFWHGILVCLVVVCPFLASAEEHDMQSEPQEKTDRQNQSPLQMIRKDIDGAIAPLIQTQKKLTTNITTLIETQETLKTRTTIYMVTLGILLFATLSAFTWLFLRYRHLDSQLNDIRKWIGMFSNVNSSFKRDLSDISNRIQNLAKTSDVEKLAIENQDSIQEILKLLKPTVDEAVIETSSPSQEKLESSEQIEVNTRDHKLTPAIADLCDRYNAGIQDKNKQSVFLQRYHNSYKIYVENATDRRVKQQTDPIFTTHHAAGNFLGCYIEEQKIYAIVPAYQLRIVHAILHYGAFIDVFECHEYEFDDPDSCYEVVRIIEPAIFEPDDLKETWTLKTKGKLELKEV